MYDNSEDAMNANEAISFGRAAAELRSHGMSCRPTDNGSTHIMVWDNFSRTEDGAAAWETIPCRTKAILEWLGY